MELQQLTYPRKSHRKSIVLPQECEELAELMGIIYGDGGIGNPWQVIISLNSVEDQQYSEYIVNLMVKLFSVTPVVKKRPNENTLLVITSSTSLVDFVVGKGAARGNKLQQISSIPAWIFHNKAYTRSFIRGMVDTDGCLYTHNHWIKGKNYVNIGFCFTNYRPEILIAVKGILEREGLKVYSAKEARRLYMYSTREIEKYLNIFGSSNSRIFQKYKDWRNEFSQKQFR